MELTLIGAVFLFLIVADNLVTANIAVGASCSAGSTCVSGAECDKVYEKCLLKQGQDCTANTLCIFGASCSTKCLCGAGYNTVTASNLCVPKTGGTVGTTCTAQGTECTTPNSECSSLLACKCKTGYSLDIANGQCTSAQNKGSTPGYISISLLSATFLSLSLAGYVM